MLLNLRKASGKTTFIGMSCSKMKVLFPYP